MNDHQYHTVRRRDEQCCMVVGRPTFFKSGIVSDAITNELLRRNIASLHAMQTVKSFDTSSNKTQTDLNQEASQTKAFRLRIHSFIHSFISFHYISIRGHMAKWCVASPQVSTIMSFIEQATIQRRGVILFDFIYENCCMELPLTRQCYSSNFV